MKEKKIVADPILTPHATFILEEKGKEPTEVNVCLVLFKATEEKDNDIPFVRLTPKEYVFKAHDREILVKDFENCKIYHSKSYLTDKKVAIDLANPKATSHAAIAFYSPCVTNYLTRYYVENGVVEPICVPLETDVYYNPKTTMPYHFEYALDSRYQTLYYTREQAEALGDVFYIDEKGNRVKKYTNNLSVATPTSEQQALLTELTSLIKKIRESGIEFCYDCELDDMIAVNMQSGLVEIGEFGDKDDTYAEFAPNQLRETGFDFPHTYLNSEMGFFVKQK